MRDRHERTTVMTTRPIGIGAAGLGRAFTLMLPTWLADPRVKLVAGADPLPAARAQFERDFGRAASPDVAAMCADPAVDVVYVASPHQFHAEHAKLAFAARKHVLVEKPMAVTLDECTAMIDAAQHAGRYLIVGHSHSFNRPVARVRELIASGTYGDVRMITALNYTDFLYRPRRPEELSTDAGGGVVFSQGAHQIDVVRLLGGGELASLRAHSGAWDPARPTEGAYSALLRFQSGAFANATYSGYAHYDSDELLDGIGEMGQLKSAEDYGAARRRLAAVEGAAEAAFKASRNYGGSAYALPPAAAAKAWQHFGFVVVSCDRADLRPTATGIMVYADRERRFAPLPPPAYPRAEVIDELVAAVVDDRPPVHDGAWARATLEACLAILESAREQRDVPLRHQVAVRDATPGAAAGASK
jgi:phthalate 4,5-cis-dihydrodiol dehydrogenase